MIRDYIHPGWWSWWLPRWETRVYRYVGQLVYENALREIAGQMTWLERQRQIKDRRLQLRRELRPRYLRTADGIYIDLTSGERYTEEQLR